MSRKPILRIAALFCMAALSMGVLPALPAEAQPGPLLTLNATDGLPGGKAKFYGEKAGDLGCSGGDIEGTLTFENLPLPDGEYYLLVYYGSGSDDRYFDIRTNSGEITLDCPNTGGFDVSGCVAVTLVLKSGGFLSFGSDWYAPDLYSVEIYRAKSSFYPERSYENAEEHTWGNDALSVVYDLRNGVYSICCGGQRIVNQARAEFTDKGVLYATDGFKRHLCLADGPDGLILRHEGHPDFGGSVEQRFFLHSEGCLVTQVVVSGEEGRTLCVDYCAPLSAARGDVGIENAVFLRFPFDNDKWEEPTHTPVSSLAAKSVSCEVAALYDANTGAGLTVGSLLHDLWKTGIELHALDGEICSLDVYGGLSDAGTRDRCAHGALTGEEVSSPPVFIDLFDDWRVSLGRYADESISLVQPAQSNGLVPFGFNSWGSMQGNVSYSALLGVSDYVKNNLQDLWTGDGNEVYINIDSYWDYIAANDPACGMTNDEALAAFVAHCAENGQKAGIYFTPFAIWYDDEETLKTKTIAGTGYTYYDAALRLPDGRLYGKLDGGWALDPTHPGTKARIRNTLEKFIALGFSYVKLDFLTHGALEGKHFDESIATGMQAYNAAMAEIAEICAGKLFVNLSIAPVFPYRYAQGRRISCDAFSSLDNTQHVLANLTSFFWLDGLYAFPDPDHLVVSGVSESVARCRVTAGAICGTSFLVGEDLSLVKENSEKDKLIKRLFANEGVLSVARLGRAFAPISIKPGQRCADGYFLVEGGELYLALFNFGSTAEKRTVDTAALAASSVFSRGGEPWRPDGTIDAAAFAQNAQARELWSDKLLKTENGSLTVTIPARDALLIRVSAPEEPTGSALDALPMAPAAFIVGVLTEDRG